MNTDTRVNDCAFDTCGNGKIVIQQHEISIKMFNPRYVITDCS